MITCPRCANSIAAADINEQGALARCARCGEVFSTLKDPPPSPELPMPKSITVRHEGDELLIVWRWFRPKWLVFLCFGLFFIILGATVLPGAFATLTTAQRYGILLPFLTPVAIFYIGLCKLFNRTEVRARKGEVAVRHVPLPFARSLRLDARAISQLYCARGYQRTPRGGIAITYAVDLVLAGGDRRRLIGELGTEAEAKFIEQALERYLDIADRPVVGEMRRE